MVEWESLDHIDIADEFETERTANLGVHMELGQAILAKGVPAVDHDARETVGKVIGTLAERTVSEVDEAFDERFNCGQVFICELLTLLFEELVRVPHDMFVVDIVLVSGNFVG